MRKHILLLVNDHQAYYGHDRHYHIRRPNYEKLVEKGTHFPNAYCSTPLCCPSRRTIVSGLYTAHHGQFKNGCAPFLYETYLERLKDSGYDVFHYGKWHTGKGTPGDFGAEGIFCEEYGNPYLSRQYQAYIKEKNLPFPKAYIEHNWCTPEWIDDLEEHTEYEMNRETMNECISGILTTPKETHEVFFMAHEACKKLETLKDTETPFCMQVHFWGPHQPYTPTKEYADLYDPKDIKEYPSFRDDLTTKPDIYQFEGGKGISENYRIQLDNDVPWSAWAETMSRCYGQITMTDEAGGLIIDKLEELGLAKDTLIIWTADHGDALASHGGHFDKDAYMIEETLRIPFGMRCDGVVTPGDVNTNLISNVDIAPTILGAAGTGFHKSVDGRNILDLYTDKTTIWRDQVYMESFGHHVPHRAQVLTDQQYKYVRNRNQLEELYDLNADEYEMNNLAFDQTYTNLLKEKRRLLDQFLEENYIC